MEHCITATGPVPTRRISSELGPLHITSTWAWRCLWRWAPASGCSRVLSRPWPLYSLLALHQVFMRVCCMLSLHYNLLPWWSCVWQWFTWQTTATAVQRDDVLRLLPEEQLQELPDVLHSGAVLPHLLLPSSRGSSWTVNETAAEMVPPPLPEKWSGCVSHGRWRYDLAS